MRILDLNRCGTFYEFSGGLSACGGPDPWRRGTVPNIDWVFQLLTYESLNRWSSAAWGWPHPACFDEEEDEEFQRKNFYENWSYSSFHHCKGWVLSIALQTSLHMQSKIPIFSVHLLDLQRSPSSRRNSEALLVRSFPSWNTVMLVGRKKKKRDGE